MTNKRVSSTSNILHPAAPNHSNNPYPHNNHHHLLLSGTIATTTNHIITNNNNNNTTKKHSSPPSTNNLNNLNTNNKLIRRFNKENKQNINSSKLFMDSNTISHNNESPLEIISKVKDPTPQLSTDNNNYNNNDFNSPTTPLSSTNPFYNPTLSLNNNTNIDNNNNKNNKIIPNNIESTIKREYLSTIRLLNVEDINQNIDLDKMNYFYEKKVNDFLFIDTTLNEYPKHVYKNLKPSQFLESTTTHYNNNKKNKFIHQYLPTNNTNNNNNKNISKSSNNNSIIDSTIELLNITNDLCKEFTIDSKISISKIFANPNESERISMEEYRKRSRKLRDERIKKQKEQSIEMDKMMEKIKDYLLKK